MSKKNSAGSSNTTGYEPQEKKPRLITADADKAEENHVASQPMRVMVWRVSWQPMNRGGQGVLPLHVHDVAFDICTYGTSARRYGKVSLVEVPEDVKAEWLAANHRKANMNPLLADFGLMDKTGPLYACLRCTHFVEAQKLIKESGRQQSSQGQSQNEDERTRTK